MIINKEKNTLKFNPFLCCYFLTKMCINSNLNQPKSNDYYTVEKDTISDEFVVNEEELNLYHQNIINPKIKSIQLSSEKLKLVEPCYYLNSGQKINIDFDFLNPILIPFNMNLFIVT